MATDECIIHKDLYIFICKYSSEIQAVHFGSSHQQATLHTGILCVGGSKESTCFSTISPSKHKSPAAIWEHLNPVLDYVQATNPEVSVIHLFSDGPCTQYKQKGNFFLFSTELAKRGIKAGTWNFFEASHGKGAPGGVGAALKRTADMLISHGRDIQDAHEIFEALLETNTSIKLFFVNDDTVEQALERMPSNLPAVPATGGSFGLHVRMCFGMFLIVLELIPPPKPVTTWHMEIQEDVWARLSE
ncbi:NACHT, LRR and PYD domains-containing protein 14-like [Tachysurus ichikawai]